MKKLWGFGGPDPKSSPVGGGGLIDPASSGGGGGVGGGSGALSGMYNNNPNIGKVFSVGRTSVQVEDVIAEGGQAIIFLVRPTDAGGERAKSLMALKRMFVNNEKDLAVCKREISIVSNLNGHKNIIGYVDSAITLQETRGVYEVLLLMPYHKTPLLALMNERVGCGGFSEEEVLRIFCDLCEAVARLHFCQTPIIHRDLKVENILRAADGNYVLCDFGSATAKVLNPQTQGIAQVEEEIRKYTTLSYRSPEMVDLYNGGALTAKLDIWALGCLLYKLCYFALPFGESTLAIQSAKFSFPATPKYSDNLKKLVRYLLTPNATERPDIYQVSKLTCTLAGRKSPLQNLHNVPVPRLDRLPLDDDDDESAAASANKKNADSSAAASPVRSSLPSSSSGAASSSAAAATTPSHKSLPPLLSSSAAKDPAPAAARAAAPSAAASQNTVRERPRGKAKGATSFPLKPAAAPSAPAAAAGAPTNPFAGARHNTQLRQTDAAAAAVSQHSNLNQNNFVSNPFA